MITLEVFIVGMKKQYWQMVRGVCILAVVMIHCPQGAFGVDEAIWLVIRQFINFPVALFIFMAGYFVAPMSVNMKWFVNRGGRLLGFSTSSSDNSSSAANVFALRSAFALLRL